MAQAAAATDPVEWIQSTCSTPTHPITITATTKSTIFTAVILSSSSNSRMVLACPSPTAAVCRSTLGVVFPEWWTAVARCLRDTARMRRPCSSSSRAWTVRWWWMGSSGVFRGRPVRGIWPRNSKQWWWMRPRCEPVRRANRNCVCPIAGSHRERPCLRGYVQRNIEKNPCNTGSKFTEKNGKEVKKWWEKWTEEDDLKRK